MERGRQLLSLIAENLIYFPFSTDHHRENRKENLTLGSANAAVYLVMCQQEVLVIS